MTRSSSTMARRNGEKGTRQSQGRRTSTFPALSGGASTLKYPSTDLRTRSSLNSAPASFESATILRSERSTCKLSAAIKTMACLTDPISCEINHEEGRPTVAGGISCEFLAHPDKGLVYCRPPRSRHSPQPPLSQRQTSDSSNCRDRDRRSMASVGNRMPRRQAGLAAELTAAFQHHQPGRVERAATLYRKILNKAPHNPDALHLL